MVDRDDITNRRVKRVANEFGLTIADVHEALDSHPLNSQRDTFLRRTLVMELLELDELQAAFRDKALKDRDVASGMLLCKVAERRQVLLGLTAPAGHAITIHAEPPERKQNSTERIYEVISRIAKVPYKPPNGGDPDPPANGED